MSSESAKRTAVLVIDLQQKYTMSGAKLEIDNIEQIVASVNEFVAATREKGARIVFVNRRVRPETGPGRRTMALFGGDLSAFQNNVLDSQDPRLEVHDGDITVVKPRHSAFYGTDLDVALRCWGIDHLILAGVTTNVCCMATAFDAVARDYAVTVASDLTASLPMNREGLAQVSANDVQTQALNLFEYAVGDVRTSDQIVGTLAE